MVETGMSDPRNGDLPEDPPQGAFGEHLGRAIRVIRAGQDLSRKELAERSGLSYSYLAEIENGSKTPSSKALAALAQALGVAVRELLGAAERWEHRPPPHSFEELRDAALGARRSPPPDTLGLGEERRRLGLPLQESLPTRAARLRSASQRRELLRSLVAPAPSEAADRATATPEEDEGVEIDAYLDTLTASRGGLEDAAELLRLLARLDPDDRERVLDLARRLADA
jgi:transcriptional regulator with XRE-family HTH domain